MESKSASFSNSNFIGNFVQGNVKGDVKSDIKSVSVNQKNINGEDLVEKLQLPDLINQLKNAVETSSELNDVEKQKALDYLKKIGDLSSKETEKHQATLTILLDAFQGTISRAASLIEPVKKIADLILSIWQT